MRDSSSVGRRASALYERADTLFKAGSFSRCLRTLDEISTNGVTAQVLLLKAQALLRLKQLQEARAVLERAISEPMAANFGPAIASLLSEVCFKLDDPSEGARWLARVRRADPNRAFFAEAQLRRALNEYRLGNASRAIELASQVLIPVADSYSARAHLMLGWIVSARMDYTKAYGHFWSGLEWYRRSPGVDEGYRALIVYALAILVAEVGIGDVAAIEREARAVMYSKDLAFTQVQTLVHIGHALQVRGDDRKAMSYYVEAAELAPGTPGALFGLSEAANLALKRAQHLSAEGFARNASAVAARIDWTKVVDEERLSLLMLARVLGLLHHGTEAQQLFSVYQMREQFDDSSTLNYDSRLSTLKKQIEGAVLCAEVAVEPGRKMLLDARDLWNSIGYARRADESRFDYETLCGSDLEFADPGHDLALRIRAIGLSQRDEEVLKLLLGGLDNREIAARTGLAEKSIRNRVSSLYDRLGVNARHQLIARFA